MTDRRRSAAGQSGQEDNPFAAPPEGRPDQPWRPRRPTDGGSPRNDQDDDQSQGDGGGNGDGGGQDDQAPSWGSQWSRHQPGRQSGGFGQQPGNGRGNGANGRHKAPGGLRWDPTDPAQRKARFALLAGMWGFFFGLFNIPPVALLLGALALYWGVSALRMRPRTGAGVREIEGDAPTSGMDGGPAPSETAEPRPGVPGNGRGTRQQRTAAVMGLVSGGLAVLIVAATFTVQIVYRDYYTCVDDALTTPTRHACEEHLPKPLRTIIDGQD